VEENDDTIMNVDNIKVEEKFYPTFEDPNKKDERSEEMMPWDEAVIEQ